MRSYAAEGALVLAALLFGATFPLVHDALADIQPFAYLVLRFAIAVVVLAPFAVVIARRRHEDRRMLLRVGLIAGTLLASGYAAQTVGLKLVSPSTSAFITGLYVVLTPLVEGVVHRRLPPPAVLGGVAVAAVGLYLLTGATVALGAGELATLLCAALYAVWIVYQGEYANRLHPIPFTTVQMLVIVVVCLPPTAAQASGRSRVSRCSPPRSPVSPARRSPCPSRCGVNVASGRAGPRSSWCSNRSSRAWPATRTGSGSER